MYRGLGSTSAKNRMQRNQYFGSERHLRIDYLDGSVSDDEFISYFQRRYGIDCVERGNIVRDHATGRSKEHGYITFANSSITRRVLQEKSHIIGGKKVRCKIAHCRKEHSDEENKHLRTIYVGDLNINSTIKELQDYFSSYGEIESCRIAYDSNKKSLGFGFVTFQNVESVDDVQENRPHSINGEPIQTRRNYPKDYPKELKKPHTVLYVLNYDDRMNNDDIELYFGEWGNIKSTRSKMKRPENKRYMEIEFDDYDDVDAICLIGDHTINGCLVHVTKFPGSKEFDILFKTEPSIETTEPDSSKKIHSFSYEREDSESGDGDCVNCCIIL